MDARPDESTSARAGIGWSRALILGLALMAAGCDPDETPTPVGETPFNLPSLGTPASPASELTLEERVAKVQRDADGLVPLLNAFWTTELQALYGIAFDTPDEVLWYVPPDWDPCGADTQDWSNNAFYCPLDGDEKVEYDVNFFQNYLVRHPGGATTFYILAHEWGHAVQDTWFENAGNDVWDPAYRKELNADCLAGVFIARSLADGTITEEDGDAEAIFTRLFESGSQAGWLNPGSHGTAEERQIAFADGVLNDTAYCRTTY